MVTELGTSWPEALAVEYRNLNTSIYVVKVMPQPETTPPLEGYIEVQIDGMHSMVKLSIPLSTSYVRYTQEDVAMLDRYLNANNRTSIIAQCALDSMMAHRNLLALGLSSDSIRFLQRGDVDKVIPAWMRERKNGFGFTRSWGNGFDYGKTPDSLTLHLNEPPTGSFLDFLRAESHNIDPEAQIKRYTAKIGERFPSVRIEPFDFAHWKEAASKDFAGVKLL